MNRAESIKERLRAKLKKKRESQMDPEISNILDEEFSKDYQLQFEHNINESSYKLGSKLSICRKKLYNDNMHRFFNIVTYIEEMMHKLH